MPPHTLNKLNYNPKPSKNNKFNDKIEN